MKKNSLKLIVGANGFVGKRLLKPSDRALVRKSASLPNEVIGDLLDPASLKTACKGIGTVFHCAGHAHDNSPSNNDINWKINFEGTRNLVNAAGLSGVQNFVFLSSVKAMAEPGNTCLNEDSPGEPVSQYGKAKRAAEDAVLDAGLKFNMNVVNLRLAMVYGRGGRGNLERMAQAIKSGWFPPLPETGNHRSMVHVNDVVRAIRLVSESPEASGQTYIIADQCPYSGRQIYSLLRQSLNMKPTNHHIPAGVLRLAGQIGDIAGGILRRRLSLSSEEVAKLLSSAWYSADRIERELGWRSEISLNEGLREMFGSGY